MIVVYCQALPQTIRKHRVGLQKFCEDEWASASLVLDKRNE